MRIDVALDHRDIDAELARLHQRMHTRGDALHAMPTVATPLPGMVFRYREVDGEFYVYVEDTVRRALAGCTVFNRVRDADRNASRFLRSPHSRYAGGYQRRGLATAVYTWALAAGLCLVSGPRQSPGAHRLWQALAARHELLYVRLGAEALQVLPGAPDGPESEAFGTRMVLLGAGWDSARLARLAGSGYDFEPVARG
ncbi:N-acetyltransferase [Ramlibacter terrae]|uniref:N-acetyltransferase n=1 Tax=Ramlibacter terrae TaxID=2732511 RepID=A0ABX6P1J4_9BURK|nr:N-acetyltransferase [Ramlibacter terrae]